MGAGVVAAVTPNWMDWVAELFGDAEDADYAFSLGVLSEASRRVAGCLLQLNGPYAYNVTSEQDWVHRDAPDGYDIMVGGAELLAGLEQADWPNAVAFRRMDRDGAKRLLRLLCMGHGNEVVGVASATTDSDTLWQIGIDVHSEHRGRGLGAALTSQAARRVLDCGRVPYYGSSVNNIASRAHLSRRVLPLLGVGIHDIEVALNGDLVGACAHLIGIVPCLHP